ncbi:MSMEG_0570 family nitrogen starvation response protein [Aquimarina agarilytica]|uniref:MSMEG_0570 family nitrogen starvation response protein n=1 Tax=Aquimarina agarilytica TaxID=1087449 RepID=UPI00028801D5|nr:MSMEG_0570 family nitrogen starvation response protein [Aquimarina agarilytica]
MPVTYVNIEWPDNKTDQVYSPSSIVEDYFSSGQEITVEEFLSTCNTALNEASERVRQKYGYACTSAQAESHRINELCQTYEHSKKVKIVSIK